jgi:glycosyltransferase involved in cell wall biosynthesis
MNCDLQEGLPVQAAQIPSEFSAPATVLPCDAEQSSRQCVSREKPMPPDKIKLLKFLTLFAIGGTERQVVNLVRQLDHSKFDLQMACFQRRGQFLEEVLSMCIPISEYKIDSLYNPRTWLQQIRLAQFLKRQRIQIVHTYGFYSTVFAVPAARMAGTPSVVVSIRDIGESLTKPQKRLQRLVCRLADSILVNAEAVRQWLMSQGYNAKNIDVIRNGIALDRFEKKSGNIRQELGIEPGVPLIAMLARLNPLKGTEYFLEAAAAVARRFPQARFLIVGDVGGANPHYKQELERKALQLGVQDKVIFTGFRLDIAELLGEVTVSVLPSLSEGLSNILLESMAAGVPVIATQVGGNPEIVEDGITGKLVPPRDSEAFAEALCLLLENPELAKQYGRAGRRRIAEHFSMDGMIHRTEQHYLKLLGNSPARLPMGAQV